MVVGERECQTGIDGSGETKSTRGTLIFCIQTEEMFGGRAHARNADNQNDMYNAKYRGMWVKPK